MPFTCEITLEPGQLQHGPLIFDAWIDQAWHRYVPEGTAFARAHDRRGQCVLEICGPGILSTKPDLKPDDRLDAGMLIARYQTDGEDIIYGRSACRITYT
jgi:hypothetical protein